MSKTFAEQIAPGEFQAKYWTGPVTRSEFQDYMNKFSDAINEQNKQLAQFSMFVLFLMDRTGLSAEELQKELDVFADKRAKELAAREEAQAKGAQHV